MRFFFKIVILFSIPLLISGCYHKVISSYKNAKETGEENFVLTEGGKKLVVDDVIVKNGNTIKEIKGAGANQVNFESVTAFQNKNAFFKRLPFNSKMVYDYTEKNYYGPQGFVIRIEKGALNIYQEVVRDIMDDNPATFSKGYMTNYYVEDPSTANVAVLTQQNVTKFVWGYVQNMLVKIETAVKIMDDYRNSAKGKRSLKEVYKETNICIDAVKKYNEEMKNGLIK
ncbi:MAG: hypothetical protein U0V75_06980 [Ferruginibacter sp.]